MFGYGRLGLNGIPGLRRFDRSHGTPKILVAKAGIRLRSSSPDYAEVHGEGSIPVPLPPPYWRKSPYFSVLPELGYLPAHMPAHTSERTENELLGRAFNRERCGYSRCFGLIRFPTSGNIACLITGQSVRPSRHFSKINGSR